MFATGVVVQFIAIWSDGIGFHALEVAVYIAIAGWITRDLVDLKDSNRLLLLAPQAV